MTRFLYVADTHLGAAPMGYTQQRGYPERLGEICRALVERVAAWGGVDFVLHGGDMVDAATDANIRAAAEVFDLPVPVHLCLGNHDLTAPDAVERWFALAPEFFVGGEPEYDVAADDCIIHVVPNHWCETPYFWRDAQDVRFSAEQTERLSLALDASPELPHVILTHSPVYGLPPEQTGLAGPHHAPPPSFTAQVSDILAGHDCVRCVLGGHSHMNMRVAQDGVEFVTVSALVETPFEFKLFEISSEKMSMSTVSLGPSLDFDGEYNESRAFVQGRPVDRSFSIDIGPGGASD